MIDRDINNRYATRVETGMDEDDLRRSCLDFVESLDAEYLVIYPILGETKRLRCALWDTFNYSWIGKGEFPVLVGHVDFLFKFVDALEKFITESKTELSYGEYEDAQTVVKILSEKACHVERSIEYDVNEGVL